MKITNITVGRVLTDGNYGSKKLEITAEVEHDNAFQSIKELEVVIERIVKGEEPVEKPVIPKGKLEGRKKKEELEEATVEAKPKAKAAKKKAKKTVKKVKNKHVPYNREITEHKTFFSKVMDGVDPNWKAQGLKAAKAVSVQMEGEDMFVSNTDDTLLDSFSEAVEIRYLKTFKEMNTHD